MRIRPLNDQVLVKCEPLEEKNQGGIILLPHQQRVRHGEILAVGPGRWSWDTPKIRIPPDIKPGARVAFFRENMETLNGKKLVRAMQELSEKLGADLALIPESAILGEVDKDTEVSA